MKARYSPTWMGRKTPTTAAAEAQVTAPEGPPNKRGKGGRPTTGQLAEQGELTGAKAALKDVQEAQPPQFQMRPSQRNWAKEYDREEKLVEQEEAEAILSARKERLSALEEQTTVLRANRKIALGFSGTAMHLLKSMRRAAEELDKRLADGIEDMTLKDLQSVIQTTGTTVAKAQSAVEAMVKTERYVMRHPLDLTEEEQDDLEELDADGAKMILENLSKSIHHISKKFARERPIDVPADSVEVVSDEYHS